MEEGFDIGPALVKALFSYGPPGVIIAVLIIAVIFLFRALREDGANGLKSSTEAVVANTTALQAFNQSAEARLEFNREMLASNREMSGSMRSLEAVSKTQHETNTEAIRDLLEHVHKMSRDIDDIKNEMRRGSGRVRSS